EGMYSNRYSNPLTMRAPHSTHPPQPAPCHRDVTVDVEFFLCVCAAELWQFQPRSQPVLSLRRVDMCRWTQAPWSLSPTSSASPTDTSSRGSGFCAPASPPALRTKRIEACSASSASACLPGRWRLLRRFAGRRPHRPRHLGHL